MTSAADIALSVIIVSYNASEILQQCLENLRRAVKNLSHEIIVVDNHSEEPNVEMIKHGFPEVRVIENDANLGFACANNLALQHAKGRFVLLLNSDVLVNQPAINRLLEFMAKHEECCVASPLLFLPNGQIQKSSRRRFPIIITELASLTRTSRFLRSYYYQNVSYDSDIYVDVVPGACMMIRKSALEQIGGLDENFFFLGEDIDLCRRVNSVGGKTASLGSVRVVHYHRASSGQRADKIYERINLEHFKSRAWYFRKHHGRLYELCWKIILFLFCLPKSSFWLTARTLKIFPKNRVNYHSTYHINILKWLVNSRYSVV